MFLDLKGKEWEQLVTSTQERAVISGEGCVTGAGALGMPTATRVHQGGSWKRNALIFLWFHPATSCLCLPLVKPSQKPESKEVGNRAHRGYSLEIESRSEKGREWGAQLSKRRTPSTRPETKLHLLDLLALLNQTMRAYFVLNHFHGASSLGA